MDAARYKTDWSAGLGKRLTTADRLIMCWMAVSGTTHLVVEGEEKPSLLAKSSRRLLLPQAGCKRSGCTAQAPWCCTLTSTGARAATC